MARRPRETGVPEGEVTGDGPRRGAPRDEAPGDGEPGSDRPAAEPLPTAATPSARLLRRGELEALRARLQKKFH